MKRLLTLLSLALMALSGCGKKSAEAPVVPAYNPFVSAFTSGTVSRNAAVFMVFAEDVDSLHRTDAALRRNFSIKPSVKGTFTFEDARTVAFRPATEFRRGTAYTVTADVGAFFDDARGADKRFRFGFRTQPLMLNAGLVRFSTNEADDMKYDILVNIVSADSESPETVESIVGFSEAVDAQWTHAADGTVHTLLLLGIASGDEPRTLVLTANDRAHDIRNEELLSIYIPSAAEFSVHGIEYVTSPEKYIEVTFTRALDPNQDMHGLAWIEDNRSETATVDGNRLRLYPDAGRTGSVTVRLSANLRSARGGTLGRDITEKVGITGDVPAVAFTSNGVVVPRSSELHIPFKAVWLRGVTVRVIRILEPNMGQFLQTNDLDGNNELTRVGRLLARKTLWLEDAGRDLSSWRTYSIDLREMIEPEPGAVYRVMLSFNRDLSAFPCEGAPAKSREEIEANDEVRFREESAQYDAGGYFFYNPDFDWSRWNYRDANDPCSYSFYSDAIVGRNVLATDLGLIAKKGDRNEITVLVHNLLSTDPVAGAVVEAFNFQNQPLGSSLTDMEGRAVLNTGETRPYYIRASSGQQRSYLRIDAGRELSTSSFDVAGEVVQKGIKGFIYGERGVWRPGDAIHLSFMLNDRDRTLPAGIPVIMELYNPLGQLYQRRTATHGEMGLYTFEMQTEPDAPTGAWRAEVKVGGAEFTKRVRIETIKPNRLKIDIGFGGKMLVAGERAAADLHVEWLTGAVARNLRYEIETSFAPAATKFGRFPGFVFDDPAKSFSVYRPATITGRVDAEGNARVAMNTEIGEPAPGMLTMSLVTRVFEESGDFSIDGFSIPFSPYRRYVGISSPQKEGGALNTGAKHTFGVATVDYNGNPIGGQTVGVEVYKVRWYWWWGSHGSDLADFISDEYNDPVMRFEVTTGGDGKGGFNLTMNDDQWGTYFIRVRDSVGGHSSGLLSYFDWPGTWRRNDTGSDAATRLTITTDKDTYAPGEKIAVTIPTPQGSRAIVSVENGSRVLSIREQMCDGGQTTIHIDATAEMQPNVYVNVTLLQPHALTGNDLPIRMYGIVPVTVTAPGSRLDPRISAPDETRPEERYEVTVSERTGRPMSYTLAIVDEGLLDLTRFPTPDPWAAFNGREALGVSTWDMYDFVVGAYGGRIEQLFSIGGDNEIAEGRKTTANRFTPVVQFDGPFALRKGERRKHTYSMPNYNGRVRIMVVAGDGEAYGSAQQTMMVRKPVMLLGTLPRVIGPGEEMDVPATVFATKEGVGEVRVAITCSDNMEIVGETSKTVNFQTIGDKQAVFRIRVKSRPGVGKITLTAAGGGDRATYETEIAIRSVRRPQTRVIPATIVEGAAWKGTVELPGAPGTNSLTLEISTIPPVNLSSRLGFLLGFPHGCIEQITSKAFPQLFVGQFAALTAAQQNTASGAVKETLRRYKSYQTAEGAMAYWPGATSTNAWGSVYAAHFMAEAEAKGYLVPENVKTSLLNNLRLVARRWQPGQSSYSRSEQLTQAYRLYALALSGPAETGAMNRLREDASLAPVARWMLAAAYSKAGRQDVAKELLAKTTPLTTGYDYEYDLTFGSPLRDEAIYLIALVGAGMSAEAADAAIRISGKLSSDEWFSTQTTAYALIALSRYMERYSTAEKMTASYAIGGTRGSVDTDKNIWSGPLAASPDASPMSAEIRNTGKGTLHVRLITEGTPYEGDERAYSNGISLKVSYLDTNGRPVDVSRLAKGDNITAVATVANVGPRTIQNVVLTQVFPAGWEILNTRFLEVTPDGDAPGVNFQDIRDDRVYSHIDRLPRGRSVTVRLNLTAAYGGRFYLPPVWCEAMYDNRTTANTEGQTVTVE